MIYFMINYNDGQLLKSDRGQTYVIIAWQKFQTLSL